MQNATAKVLGVLRRPDSDEFLVQRLDTPQNEPFYRPIGGGVQRGETTADALEREFREELDVTVEAGAVCGTVENVFHWDGERESEIIVLREATFTDASLYERDHFDGIDAGGAVEYDASWRSVTELRAAEDPLYPEGIDAVLDGETSLSGRGHLVSASE